MEPAAELAAAPLLNSEGARAWLAIEDPAKPWPPLSEGKHSAGPFYLVWTDPRAGNISPEQWPFEVASIKRLAPVAERFPALLPDPALRADDPVNKGFALFQKNCLACHQMDAKMVGPSYKDVAKKYKGDAGAAAKLATKIQKGGAGAWGQIPMPPHPNVNDAEAQTLAKWILAQ